MQHTTDLFGIRNEHHSFFTADDFDTSREFELRLQLVA